MSLHLAIYLLTNRVSFHFEAFTTIFLLFTHFLSKSMPFKYKVLGNL